MGCLTTCFNYETGKFDDKKTILNALGKHHFSKSLGALFGQFAIGDGEDTEISIGDLLVYKTASTEKLDFHKEFRLSILMMAGKNYSMR